LSRRKKADRWVRWVRWVRPNKTAGGYLYIRKRISARERTNPAFVYLREREVSGQQKRVTMVWRRWGSLLKKCKVKNRLVKKKSRGKGNEPSDLA
jgi:hypothetical protein